MLLEQRKSLVSSLRSIIQDYIEVDIPVVLERPKHPPHGDVSTNIAMRIAKITCQEPLYLAQDIARKIMGQPSMLALFQKATAVHPGFVNFYLTPDARRKVLSSVNQQGANYGKEKYHGKKIIIEFVSANPTGPLHVGHARQAVLGDAICRLHEASGYKVMREFYYNDTGNQIRNLVLSVQAKIPGENAITNLSDHGFDTYKGEYISDIAKDFMAFRSIPISNQIGDATRKTADLEEIRQFSVAYLKHEQEVDLKALGVTFDNYYLESSLHASGKVERIVEDLRENHYVYESEGATWLRTTGLNVGDDKDRVIRKKDGSYTYFIADIAYHKTKWERGFDKAINIQGSDHHGTIARVRAGLQALNLGIPKEYPTYLLHKMVKVVKNKVEVKVSKRAGNYLTLRDLTDWAGRDAVRYFLIQRRADSEFVFDIDLALSKKDANPVYYIQYAHARLCSVIANSGVTLETILSADTSPLVASSEIELMKRLAEFPEVVSNATQGLSPHCIAAWLRDCAADLHTWYNSERILSSDKALKIARLNLVTSVRQVLANGLDLLGISAPQKM